MVKQIALGSAVMLGSIAIAGMWLWIIEMSFSRWAWWLLRPPHRPKLIVVVLASALVVLAMMMMSVWLWALTFHLLHIFPSFEEGMYFTLVTFTTLGYGDVLMPKDWRILGGMAAANGLLSFGMMNALMIEALRHVRVRQITLSQD